MLHTYFETPVSQYISTTTSTSTSTAQSWVDTRDVQQNQQIDRVVRENADALSTLLDVEKSVIATIDAVKSSVVNIIITKEFVVYDGRNAVDIFQQQVWWGSGIIVDREGYILTNKHVVEDTDATYTVIFDDGSAVESEMVWVDPNIDIAVLRVDPAVIVDRAVGSAYTLTYQPVLGQFALAIWNALAEFQNSVTLGIVSGKNRKLTIGNENLYAGLLQTDASISEWNSGWPLFDLAGKIIGINTAVSAFGENIGFAIPISQEFIDATLVSVRESDEIVRPFVGVRYNDISLSVANDLGLSRTSGIYVAEVVPGSAADDAWLRSEDIVTHLDGREITSDSPFMYQLYTYSPGDEVMMTVVRESGESEISLRLGAS